MFKEVSKSRAARLLITRADVVGDADRVRWRMLIFRENDTQAIGKFIFFEGYSDAIGASEKEVALDKSCSRVISFD
jgi:hypothetical protein